MASQRLIKFVLSWALLLPTAVTAGGSFTCKEVKIESKSVKGSEVQTLCFLRDDTYFITENCADMNCKLVQRLKGQEVPSSVKDRPGVVLCKKLKGTLEDVLVEGTKLKVQRCLFTEEKSSISLNLLESWNGKHFDGPSKPLDL